MPDILGLFVYVLVIQLNQEFFRIAASFMKSQEKKMAWVSNQISIMDILVQLCYRRFYVRTAHQADSIQAIAQRYGLAS